MTTEWRDPPAWEITHKGKAPPPEQIKDIEAMLGACLGLLNVGYEPKRIAVLLEAAPDLLAALKEIAKGEGTYSRDQLEHCTNTVESMKEIAQQAIAKAEKGVDDET